MKMFAKNQEKVNNSSSYRFEAIKRSRIAIVLTYFETLKTSKASRKQVERCAGVSIGVRGAQWGFEVWWEEVKLGEL